MGSSSTFEQKSLTHTNKQASFYHSIDWHKSFNEQKMRLDTKSNRSNDQSIDWLIERSKWIFFFFFETKEKDEWFANVKSKNSKTIFLCWTKQKTSLKIDLIKFFPIQNHHHHSQIKYFELIKQKTKIAINKMKWIKIDSHHPPLLLKHYHHHVHNE